MAKFTVDTHIFRELGELLVGRDSTALIELGKNSYDADATEIMVYGEALDDPKRGFITLTDNGGGKTESVFVNGFLRVASRLKEEGPRVSRKFKRRYTGAKGIGHLAAHKLARLIQVHSIAWEDSSSSNRSALEAIIDWDEIEKHQTPVLVKLPKGVTEKVSLFEEPAIRDSSKDDPRFHISIDLTRR